MDIVIVTSARNRRRSDGIPRLDGASVAEGTLMAKTSNLIEKIKNDRRSSRSACTTAAGLRPAARVLSQVRPCAGYASVKRPSRLYPRHNESELVGGTCRRITDPIADLLTRIRNANTANHKTVDVPASRMKRAICRFSRAKASSRLCNAHRRGSARNDARSSSSTGRNKRKSSPDCVASPVQVCASTPAKTEIPRVLGGLGIVIISTSKGIMSGKQAKAAGVGGEVLAYVW